VPATKIKGLSFGSSSLAIARGEDLPSAMAAPSEKAAVKWADMVEQVWQRCGGIRQRATALRRKLAPSFSLVSHWADRFSRQAADRFVHHGGRGVNLLIGAARWSHASPLVRYSITGLGTSAFAAAACYLLVVVPFSSFFEVLLLHFTRGKLFTEQRIDFSDLTSFWPGVAGVCTAVWICVAISLFRHRNRLEVPPFADWKARGMLPPSVDRMYPFWVAYACTVGGYVALLLLAWLLTTSWGWVGGLLLLVCIAGALITPKEVAEALKDLGSEASAPAMDISTAANGRVDERNELPQQDDPVEMISPPSMRRTSSQETAVWRFAPVDDTEVLVTKYLKRLASADLFGDTPPPPPPELISRGARAVQPIVGAILSSPQESPLKYRAELCGVLADIGTHECQAALAHLATLESNVWEYNQHVRPAAVEALAKLKFGSSAPAEAAPPLASPAPIAANSQHSATASDSACQEEPDRSTTTTDLNSQPSGNSPFLLKVAAYVALASRRSIEGPEDLATRFRAMLDGLAVPEGPQAEIETEFFALWPEDERIELFAEVDDLQRHAREHAVGPKTLCQAIATRESIDALTEDWFRQSQQEMLYIVLRDRLTQADILAMYSPKLGRFIKTVDGCGTFFGAAIPGLLFFCLGAMISGTLGSMAAQALSLEAAVVPIAGVCGLLGGAFAVGLAFSWREERSPLSLPGLLTFELLAAIGKALGVTIGIPIAVLTLPFASLPAAPEAERWRAVGLSRAITIAGLFGRVMLAFAGAGAWIAVFFLMGSVRQSLLPIGGKMPGEAGQAEIATAEPSLSADNLDQPTRDELAAVIGDVEAFAELAGECPAYAAVQENSLPLLKQLTRWNELTLACGPGIGRLSPSEASSFIHYGQPLLARFGGLPGAEKVRERLPALEAISLRQRQAAPLPAALLKFIDGPEFSAPYVLATKQGQRFYLVEEPHDAGEQIQYEYLADQQGERRKATLPKSQLEPERSGRSPTSLLAEAWRRHLAAIDEQGWESTFCRLLSDTRNLADLDPIVEAEALFRAMRIAMLGSLSLSRGFAEHRAKLDEEMKVEYGNINWLDPGNAQSDVIRRHRRQLLENLPDFDRAVETVMQFQSGLQEAAAPQWKWVACATEAPAADAGYTIVLAESAQIEDGPVYARVERDGGVSMVEVAAIENRAPQLRETGLLFEGMPLFMPNAAGEQGLSEE
jgi:hypothetical protein